MAKHGNTSLGAAKTAKQDEFYTPLETVEDELRHYRKHFKDEHFDPDKVRAQINELMADKEVTKKRGICEYILTGDEGALNLRAFDEDQKQAAYSRQKGICPKCGNHFEYPEMEGDHIIPWSKGGKTTDDNCQMLCKRCNGIKSDR